MIYDIVMYLRWTLSLVVCSGTPAGQGLEALGSKQHQTQGKLRASDYQLKSRIRKIRV